MFLQITAGLEQYFYSSALYTFNLDNIFYSNGRKVDLTNYYMCEVLRYEKFTSSLLRNIQR